jgi:hypothetical protein
MDHHVRQLKAIIRNLTRSIPPMTGSHDVEKADHPARIKQFDDPA